MLYVRVGLILLAMALRAHGAELPPHAVAVDQYGTWTCESGYLMRPRAGGFECLPEAEAMAETPHFEVSGVPSAGEGARGAVGDGAGQGYDQREAPTSPRAQTGPSGPSVFIQSNQPWTVVLDPAGNPRAVFIREGLRTR